MFAVAIWVQPSASMATENHPDVSQRVCRFGTCSVSLSRAEAYTVDCHCVVDLCGGLFPRRILRFSWRISATDFAADFSVELSILCGGLLTDLCPKPCKLHVKVSQTNLKRRSSAFSPGSSAFFTACFADFRPAYFRGGFSYGGFPWRISVADFRTAVRTHTTLICLHGCCVASDGHLSLHMRRDWGHM